MMRVSVSAVVGTCFASGARARLSTRRPSPITSLASWEDGENGGGWEDDDDLYDDDYFPDGEDEMDGDTWMDSPMDYGDTDEQLQEEAENWELLSDEASSTTTGQLEFQQDYNYPDYDWEDEEAQKQLSAGGGDNLTPYRGAEEQTGLVRHYRLPELHEEAEVDYMEIRQQSPSDIRKAATWKALSHTTIAEVTTDMMSTSRTSAKKKRGGGAHGDSDEQSNEAGRDQGHSAPRGSLQCEVLFGGREADRNRRSSQFGFIDLALPTPHIWLTGSGRLGRLAFILNKTANEVKGLRLHNITMYIGEWMAPDVYPLHANLRVKSDPSLPVLDLASAAAKRARAEADLKEKEEQGATREELDMLRRKLRKTPTERLAELPEPPLRLPDMGSPAAAAEAPAMRIASRGFAPEPLPHAVVKDDGRASSGDDIALSGPACRLMRAAQSALAKVSDAKSVAIAKMAMVAMQVSESNDEKRVGEAARACAELPSLLARQRVLAEDQSGDSPAYNGYEDMLSSAARVLEEDFGVTQEQCERLMERTWRSAKAVELHGPALQQEAQLDVAEAWLSLALPGGRRTVPVLQAISNEVRSLTQGDKKELAVALKILRKRAAAALEIVLQLANTSEDAQQEGDRRPSRFNASPELAWYDSRMPVAAFHVDDVTRYKDLVHEHQRPVRQDPLDESYSLPEPNTWGGIDAEIAPHLPESQKFIEDALNNDEELASYLASSGVTLDDFDIKRLVDAAKECWVRAAEKVSVAEFFYIVNQGELEVTNSESEVVTTVGMGGVLGLHNIPADHYVQASVGEALLWAIESKDMMSQVDMRYHIPMQDAERMGCAGGARPMAMGEVLPMEASLPMAEYAAVRPRPPGTPLQLPSNPSLEGCLYASTGGVPLQQLLSRIDCGALSRSARARLLSLEAAQEASEAEALAAEDAFQAALDDDAATVVSAIDGNLAAEGIEDESEEDVATTKRAFKSAPSVVKAAQSLTQQEEHCSAMLHKGQLPEWGVFTDMPVMPPMNRAKGSNPIGEAGDDMDEQYKRVLRGNMLVRESAELRGSAMMTRMAAKQLQNAVDNVIDSNRAETPAKRGRGVGAGSMSSIATRVKGKKGLMRLNILGKRTDYSCRTVIVSEPALQLDEVGLPLELAAVLFEPLLRKPLFTDEHFKSFCERKLSREEATNRSSELLLQFIMNDFDSKMLLSSELAPMDAHDDVTAALKHYWRRVQTTPGTYSSARKLFKDFFNSKPTEEKADMLRSVMEGRYVCINRAPTLHRLSVQAMKPVLCLGQAMKIHPLVTPPFNADFDGDTMTVHLALSEDAQQEFKNLMVPSKNLYSPASGEPVIGPTQDMVLGLYYLTSDPGTTGSTAQAYPTPEAVLEAYEEGRLIHSDMVVVPVPAMRAVDEQVAQDIPGLRAEDGETHITLSVGRLIFFMQWLAGYDAAHRPAQALVHLPDDEELEELEEDGDEDDEERGL